MHFTLKRWYWLGVLALLLLAGCSRMTTASAEEEVTSIQEAPAGPTGAQTPSPAGEELLPEEDVPERWQQEFTTDFSRHTVPYDEVLSGGPPKDGIPAVDAPQLTTVDAADGWIDDKEPVILLEIDDEARAYPVQILMWHEIVNDTLAGRPVVVTFCPLCNTAIAFDRRFDAGDETLILDFGTTGRLRFSNLIMYDRQTETWWQQATGEGIVGRFAGEQLTFLPANMVAWADFKASYPQGTVLSRATGFNRTYGSNPYGGYDDIDNSPFLYRGPETPDELPPMARVLTIEIGKDAVAYPYTTMAAHRVVNDTVGDTPVVVMWQPGVASALDTGAISAGRDVGTVVAFSPIVDSETLSFRFDDGEIVDEGTGTVWDVFGRGVRGPLSDQTLEAVVGVNHFWFSWAAFKPDTRVYQTEAVPPEAEAQEPASDADPERDTSSPDVTSVDALETDFVINVYQGEARLGGERVRFSDVLAQGKPVVLEFWAGACPICRRALPEVQALYAKYGEDVTFIGLDVGIYTGLGDEATALALMQELDLTFPTGSTSNAAVMRDYRVTGIPTTLLFMPNGEIFNRSTGLVSGERLGEQIESLIAMSHSQ